MLGCKSTITAAAISIGLGASAVLAEPGAVRDADILKDVGGRAGLIVHVGCGDGRLTAALRSDAGCLVQGLDRSAENVARAREHVQDRGLYGAVSIDRWTGDRLPYVDNLVNCLIVEDKGGTAMTGLMRILAPGGRVYIKEGDAWKKSVKPWPGDIDEWTHYLHDASNNAVARDRVIGPPRHMQWLADPPWSRNHHKLASISSAVTANGRLFCIVDQATGANINVPGKWAIVARDAFSGVTLWEKALESWAWNQIRFRSGPAQLARLLVAEGDRVYLPLGLNAPISALDAASGKALKTFAETEGAEEMVLVDGTLIVLKGAPVAEQAFMHAAFQGQFGLPNKKSIVTLAAESGDVRWRWSNPEFAPEPETLASDGERIFFQSRQDVVCLDLKSGRELWRHQGPAETAGNIEAHAPANQKKTTAGKGKAKGSKQKGIQINFGTRTLVVADGVVLCRLADKLTAMSAKDGSRLWDCPAGEGFHAPMDVFVINGVVWPGHCVGDSISPPPDRHFSEGRDLRTGEVRKTNPVAVDLQTPGHHHRCYREKATERFIITAKRGIEMMDIGGNGHSRANWVRGICQYGILPANGLIYAPPHACGCYMEAKLHGFWALAAERSAEGTSAAASKKTEGAHETGRIERGPAFDQVGNRPPAAENPTDWPTLRHDATRSGATPTSLPTALAEEWRAGLGGKLTQPVVAGRILCVASVDAHTIHALDAESGKPLWRYIAGGRIDSPPTLYGGLVLFGSGDGWITCLRASDGQTVWRFRAAPCDLRAVARDGVESVWPAHGSVLVLDGVAYASAGRSTWLDGGIDLFGLDPATGKVLCHSHFESRHPTFGEGTDKAGPKDAVEVDQNLTDYKTYFASDRSDAFSMAEGTVSDVLVSDGANVFLHHVRFDAKLNRKDERSRHLFSTSGLLDDSENHRSHWALGSGDFRMLPVAYSWIANKPGTRTPTIAVPTGVMLVFEDGALWGVRTQGDTDGKYSLFQMQNKPFSKDEKPMPDFRDIPSGDALRYVWKEDLPVRTTAMLKSRDHLILATTPVEIPDQDPHAAYEGRLGGTIWICQASDGTKISEFRLDSPAVWDGLAAATGKLFVSTAGGSVICLGQAH